MEVFHCESRREGWAVEAIQQLRTCPGPSLFLRAQTGRVLSLDLAWKGKLTKEMDV